MTNVPDLQGVPEAASRMLEASGGCVSVISYVGGAAAQAQRSSATLQSPSSVGGAERAPVGGELSGWCVSVISYVAG